MPLRLCDEVPDRFEDRVAAVPDGWVTASARALTRWVDGKPGAPELGAEPRPGPVAWLARAGALAWGPTVLDGDRPRWSVADVANVALEDLGPGGARVFQLAAAVVAGDGRRVLAAFTRPQSRVRGGATVTDTTRLAVVDPLGGDLVETVPGAVPVSMSWGDGPLALGAPGQVSVRGDDGTWSRLPLGDPTAPRALCPTPEGGLAAGTAGGQLVVVDGLQPPGRRWPAHAGPVTALAAASGLLVSGGQDAVVRLWDGVACAGELAVAGPVAALAVVPGPRVAVLAGGVLQVLEP